MLARLVACAFAAIVVFAAWPGQAQQIDRIAAVVNDDIISNRDLEERTRMALALSHLPDTLETRRRVVPQVLRKMIDEHLQMQEAKRLKIALTDKEIDDGIAMIEAEQTITATHAFSFNTVFLFLSDRAYNQANATLTITDTSDGEVVATGLLSQALV